MTLDPTVAVSDIFAKKIVIPDYQREFRAQPDKIVMMLNTAITRDPNFIGTMIFEAQQEAELKCVDGQQRLVSLHIILSCLKRVYAQNINDHLGVDDNTHNLQEIINTLFYQRNFQRSCRITRETQTQENDLQFLNTDDSEIHRFTSDLINYLLSDTDEKFENNRNNSLPRSTYIAKAGPYKRILDKIKSLKEKARDVFAKIKIPGNPNYFLSKHIQDRECGTNSNIVTNWTALSYFLLNLKVNKLTTNNNKVALECFVIMNTAGEQLTTLQICKKILYENAVEEQRRKIAQIYDAYIYKWKNKAEKNSKQIIGNLVPYYLTDITSYRAVPEKIGEQVELFKEAIKNGSLINDQIDSSAINSLIRHFELAVRLATSESIQKDINQKIAETLRELFQTNNIEENVKKKFIFWSFVLYQTRYELLKTIFIKSVDNISKRNNAAANYADNFVKICQYAWLRRLASKGTAGIDDCFRYTIGLMRSERPIDESQMAEIKRRFLKIDGQLISDKEAWKTEVLRNSSLNYLSSKKINCHVCLTLPHLNTFEGRDVNSGDWLSQFLAIWNHISSSRNLRTAGNFLSIEHIVPQRRRQQYPKVNDIGNLILIPHWLNQRLGTRELATKKNILKWYISAQLNPTGVTEVAAFNCLPADTQRSVKTHFQNTNPRFYGINIEMTNFPETEEEFFDQFVSSRRENYISSLYDELQK